MFWVAMLEARTRFLLPTSASACLKRSRSCSRLPPCVTCQNYVNHLGTWNVSGINGTAKREEVEDVFKEGNFELLALMETKLKGNGEVSGCGVNSIIAGVEENILLNDVWHSAVVGFRCVSSRILWIKFRFSRVKVCVVVGYGPQ